MNTEGKGEQEVNRLLLHHCSLRQCICNHIITAFNESDVQISRLQEQRPPNQPLTGAP